MSSIFLTLQISKGSYQRNRILLWSTCQSTKGGKEKDYNRVFQLVFQRPYREAEKETNFTNGLAAEAGNKVTRLAILGNDETSVSDKIKELKKRIKDWKKERRSYPGWVVFAPGQARRQLWNETYSYLREIPPGALRWLHGFGVCPMNSIGDLRNVFAQFCLMIWLPSFKRF